MSEVLSARELRVEFMVQSLKDDNFVVHGGVRLEKGVVPESGFSTVVGVFLFRTKEMKICGIPVTDMPEVDMEWMWHELNRRFPV